MRALAAFLTAVLVALVAMAVLSPLVWGIVGPWFGVRFHQVATRLGLLTLLAGFAVAAVRCGVADRESLGLGSPIRQLARQAARALGLGLLTIGPPVAVMAMLGIRTARPGVTLDVVSLARLMTTGLVTGLLVAMVEEVLLRGAMFAAVARESGVRVAVGATAVIYAAAHFVGTHRIPADQVHAGSGLELIVGSMTALVRPPTMADALLCLVAVGVVLAGVRHLTGSLAVCVGLHAGWVTLIRVVRDVSVVDAAGPWSWLVSRLDGFVGWLVLAWTMLAGGALWWHSRRRVPPGARSRHVRGPSSPPAP